MRNNTDRTVAILTSGGDCAGLNAVLRAVTLRAQALGWRVLGIENGPAGLLADPPEVRVLTPQDLEGHVMRLGGTILGTTNTADPFNIQGHDRSQDVINALKGLDVQALIGIGGDGSFRILSRLAKQGGLNFVGIPKTIDNDVAMTDLAVGFDTAVAVATEALDRLQPTAASHDRVMILEVMGRDAGHIALAAGIAGGADVILIPEIPYTVEAVACKIAQVKQGGRNFALVIVSEAARAAHGQAKQVKQSGGQIRYGGVGEVLGAQIAAATGSETRVTVLGHVQRGAAPGWNDRLLAMALGVKAMDLVQEGRFGRMVAWQNRAVVDVPIAEAVARCNTVEPQGTLMQTARALGIAFGD